MKRQSSYYTNLKTMDYSLVGKRAAARKSYCDITKALADDEEASGDSDSKTLTYESGRRRKISLTPRDEDPDWKTDVDLAEKWVALKRKRKTEPKEPLADWNDGTKPRRQLPPTMLEQRLILKKYQCPICSYSKMEDADAVRKHIKKKHDPDLQNFIF